MVWCGHKVPVTQFRFSHLAAFALPPTIPETSSPRVANTESGPPFKGITTQLLLKEHPKKRGPPSPTVTQGTKSLVKIVNSPSSAFHSLPHHLQRFFLPSLGDPALPQAPLNPTPPVANTESGNFSSKSIPRSDDGQPSPRYLTLQCFSFPSASAPEPRPLATPPSPPQAPLNPTAPHELKGKQPHDERKRGEGRGKDHKKVRSKRNKSICESQSKETSSHKKSHQSRNQTHIQSQSQITNHKSKSQSQRSNREQERERERK